MCNSTKEPLADAISLGMQRARSYEWSGAIESFRKAVALDPESAEARFRLGWSLWNLADNNRPTLADMALLFGAQKLGFDQTFRDGKRRYRSYIQLLEDAVYYLRSVIERDPAQARAHHYLSRSLLALDHKEEAQQAARTAARLDPDNPVYVTFADTFDTASSPQRPAMGLDLTWDDLVLNPRTKRELRQMQLMLEKPELARELGVNAPTGILLKGPPGTGKTTIARILASEAHCSFYAITPADINQMYVGESEKRVRDLFAKARTSAPSIIFIDEIDALLPSRQGGVAIHSDKVVNQFLQEMDGLQPNQRVFVVGATNRPDMLDTALRRGGRLSREIEIPLPDLQARTQLFILTTRSATLNADVEIDELARRTEGYSGADIKALVNEAGLLALIRITDTGADASRALCMDDFRGALENLG